MRCERIGRAGVVVVVVVAAWFLIPVVRVEFLGEDSIPAAPNARSLPAGVIALVQDTPCGSGGCWRELSLS